LGLTTPDVLAASGAQHGSAPPVRQASVIFLSNHSPEAFHSRLYIARTVGGRTTQQKLSVLPSPPITN